jgi:ankyrin repeat protein
MPEKKITFLQACWQGDLAEVTRLLDNGARINQVGRDGYAGIHIAIAERNMPLLRLLGDRGAAAFSLGEKSHDVADNAVSMAAGEGFLEGFHYLVDEKGFSMQLAPKEDPAMILFDAVSNYKADNILMLRHLVEFKKLDPKRAALPDGYNLLHASELAGDSTGITEYLLDKGIDPKIEFIEGDDEEAEEAPDEEYQEENPPDFELDDTVREVLDEALEMEEAKEKEKEESNPAARKDHYSDDDDDDGDDDEDDEDDDFEFMAAAEGLPLSMAAGNGKVERVILYLRHGADAEQENDYGLTAADAVSKKDPNYVYMQEQYAQIESILELAAEKHTLPKDTRSKLLRACQLGDLAKVGKLLEAHKGNRDYINQSNEWGISAIHVAMKTRNMDLLRLLVEYGADPYQAASHSEKFADLPVEIAAENGFLEGIKYLAEEKGFDLWPIRDRPAEDLLFSAGTIQVLRYLVEEKGLKPELAIRENGEDLLRHSETMEKPPAFIEYLLNHGIDLNVEHEYSLEKEDGEPPDDEADMFGNELPPANLRAKYDGLPLVRAAFNANAVLVDIYLRHDANPMGYISKGSGKGNAALDAISDKTNPMYEFNEVSYRQISRMLQKSMEGTYGVPPPPESPASPASGPG